MPMDSKMPIPFVRTLAVATALVPLALSPGLRAETAHVVPVASHGDGTGMSSVTLPVEVGALTISEAFARATPPGAPVAGGFLLITNEGPEDETLVSVATPVSARSEIHEMRMDGDVMRMRELADGLPIPAGGSVTLEPGGYHLMFMDLNTPLIEGETVPVTLTFERAGEVEITLAIGARDASGAGHGGTQ